MTTRRAVAVMLIAVLTLGGCATLMEVTIDELIKQGIELFTARRYDEAIAKFMEVVRRDPKQWTAYLYMARSYIAKADWSNALTNARQAFQLAPSSGDVLPALAEALFGAGLDAFKRGQFQTAIGHLVEYIKLRPTDTNAYLQLGRAYLSTGAWGDALRTLVQGLTQSPDAATRGQLVRGLFDGGVQALSAGNATAAIGLLQEYVKQGPDAQGYLQLGRALLSTGAWSDAARAIVQGLGASPDASTRSELVRSLIDGGTQALSSGNARGAIALLQEYVRHDTGNVSAYLNLGKAYWQEGSLGNAMSAFQRVLQLSPNNAEAMQFIRGRR
jgi:tetratricopeptide (TPR) repeat protein